MTSATAATVHGCRDNLADAIDHLRQALGITRELACVDEDLLVQAIAAHRLVGRELGRFLKEHAAGVREPARGITSVRTETLIEAERQRLHAELEELHPALKGPP